MEVIKTAASPSSVQRPTSSSSPSSAPWLDLPEPLTDLILERLPLVDYIRFEAVCTKWQSIQHDHRLSRRSPLPFPWFYVYPQARNVGPIVSLNPFDPADPPKCRRLPLPTPDAFCKFLLASSHGWLILRQVLMDTDSKPMTVALFNPVSGTHLSLPQLAHRPHLYTACMSCPPTHPDCAVIIPCVDCVFLWRAGEPDWTTLPCPKTLTASSKVPLVQTSIFHDRKFYFLRSEGLLGLSLFVVDPFLNMPAAADDVVRLVDMGWSHTPFTHKLWSSTWRTDWLVECNGDLLMVVALVPEDIDVYPLQGLLVFKAVFSRKMWVRVESLGDCALFLSTVCSFSLPAANVGVAENCVYVTDLSKPIPLGAAASLWTAFDLGAGRVVDLKPLYPNTCSEQYGSMPLEGENFWIIPRLASVTPTSD